MGRVPSGCASFTSAPARILSRAPCRLPARMRSASEVPDWPRTGATAASTQAHARATRLHNIRSQLVVVRPQTLGGVVQELVRVAPRAREPLQNATLQHVVGAVAFPNAIEQALPNFLHHVPLGLE